MPLFRYNLAVTVIKLPHYFVCLRSSSTARRLQSVLNAAARLVYHTRSADRITDELNSVHWLRVPQRSNIKIGVLTYKVLYGSVPRYLGPLVDRPISTSAVGAECRCTAGYWSSSARSHHTGAEAASLAACL